MDISGFYKEDNDIWGEPQEYKKIKFYPLRLSEIEERGMMYKLFSYPKNHIPDPTILKMSYLKYILYIIAHIQKENNEKEIAIEKTLQDFLKHITKSENVSIGWNQKDNPETLQEIKFQLNIDDVVFDEFEVDVLREIILKQNGISIKFIEEFNPELEKKLAFENRNNNNDTTFQDEIFSFCAIMKKTPDDIKNYTLYQFKTMMSRLSLLQNYELYKPLEASGQISFKDGGEITHYLSHIKEAGRYDSILIDKNSYVEKSDIFKASESK